MVRPGLKHSPGSMLTNLVEMQIFTRTLILKHYSVTFDSIEGELEQAVMAIFWFC
jgi:hypothetical protein